MSKKKNQTPWKDNKPSKESIKDRVSRIDKNQDSLNNSVGESLKLNADNAAKIYQLYEASLEQYKKTNERLNQIDDRINKFDKHIAKIEDVADQAIDLSIVTSVNDHKADKARSDRAKQLAGMWIAQNHGYRGYGGGEYFGLKTTQFKLAITKVFKDKFNIASVHDLRVADLKKALTWIPKINFTDLDEWRYQDRKKALKVLNKWEKNHGFSLTKPED